MTVGVKEDFHFEKVQVKFEDRILSTAKTSYDNRWDNDDLTVDRKSIIKVWLKTNNSIPIEHWEWEKAELHNIMYTRITS